MSNGTLLVIDSSQLDTSKNGTADMEVKFANPIYNSELKAEVALMKLNTFFSVFNITEKLGNNILRYSNDNGATWNTYTIPDGIYNIEDVHELINGATYSNGGISIFANFATGIQRVELLAGWQIDWSVSFGLAEWLGFDRFINDDGIQVESGNGITIGDVTNGITAFVIRCSLIQGRAFDNGNSSDSLFTFTPRVAGFSSLEVEPKNLVYIPVNDSVIRGIRIQITDQRGNLLDFNGENITCLLHLRFRQ